MPLGMFITTSRTHESELSGCEEQSLQVCIRPYHKPQQVSKVNSL